MLSRLHNSIGIRFLAVVGILVALFSCFVLYRTWENNNSHTTELLNNQTELALQFDLAIREYVAESIRPFAEAHVAEGDFVPETMSTSFVARSVFDKVRRRFPDYIIKFSSDNPRNPANQAGPEELEVIKYFNNNPQLAEWSGQIELDGKRYQAHFHARRMKKKCLRCHGDPRDAPRALVARYGDTAGFHRRMDKVMALDMIAIPNDKFQSAAAAETARNFVVFAIGLGVLLAAIYCTFHFLVARRLAVISRHFTDAVAQEEGPLVAPIEYDGHDEIGKLADSFNVLAERLRQVYGSLERRVVERTAELETTNANLTKEVAERERVEADLRESNRRLAQLYQKLGSTADELKALMNEVVENGAFTARFKNPCLAKCWEIKGCEQEACPAYGRHDNLRCWEIAGTFCRGEVQGTFARKLQDCRKCELYQSARRDSISDLGETFNDMVMALQDRQRELDDACSAAESANRAKSAFLANMSHEIRTPMTAVLGFTESLLDPQQTESERLRAVDTIRRNGEHLLSIINDILDISKIEAGKAAFERVSCSPARLVADVGSLMRGAAGAKGLDFRLEYAGALPEVILTDPTRLRQILLNLVGNAVKFTEAGSVRLVVELVGGGDPVVQFDVVDTGLGLTAEQAKRIFEPFAQADNSTTREFGGTGLGLTISKRLAELLGGDLVLAETRAGVGTRFRLTVGTGPLEGVAMLDDPASSIFSQQEPVPQPAAPLDLGGCRVLLAEDGRDNQRLIALLLEKAGAQVDLAENGRLAVDAILVTRDESMPFDVVLMDMQMPVMDGYEATALLRQHDYTGTIIALTAHAMAEDRQKCLDAGCDDYLSKPIDRVKLLKTIRSHLPDGSVVA